MSVLVGGRRVGPQVNKFKQVSRDDHQMSVAGVGYVQGVRYVQRGVGYSRGELGYVHEACEVPTLPVDRINCLCENITFLQLLSQGAKFDFHGQRS